MPHSVQVTQGLIVNKAFIVPDFMKFIDHGKNKNSNSDPTWSDFSFGRLTLDTVEIGLERSKSGKEPSRKELQPLCWKYGGLDQEDSSGGGGKYMNQQDLMFGFRRWEVSNNLLIFPSLLPSTCLLRIHEMCLVLTTHHSVIDYQTLSLAPTSPMTFRSKISTVAGEHPTDGKTHTQQNPNQSNEKKKSNPENLNFLLFNASSATFFCHPGYKPYSHHLSGCEDFLIFWYLHFLTTITDNWTLKRYCDANQKEISK